MFDVQDFFRLATGTSKEPIPVCRINWHLARAIGAMSNMVFLSDYTLAKQFSRHPDLGLGCYEALQYAVDHGLVVRNERKPNFLFFMVELAELDSWIKATIKADRIGLNLWLVSFHQVRPSDRRKVLRSGKVIREANVTKH